MRALPMLVAALLSVTSAAETTGADVKKQAGETVDASKRYLNEKKEDFEARIEAKLAELKAKAEALDRSTRKQGDQLQAGAKEKLAAIAKQQQAAADRLEAMKKAGGSAWKSLKGGVEQAVNDLDQGLNGASK